MVESLKIFEVLKAHLPEPQARVVTQAIQQTEAEIGQDLRSFLPSAFASFATKADLAMVEARLRTKIADSEARTIRWMFVFWVGQLGSMVALLKLLR